MPLLFAFYAFAIGAVVGSFLNVVIHRWPREESIVFPASRCPSCRTPIKPWDNIPVLSYMILGGRCRACRAPISPRYPLVELANALFYVALFERTGVTLVFLPLAAIVSMTIALIFIDAEVQMLPDAIDLPGIGVGLLIGWLSATAVSGTLVMADGVLDSLIGATAGAALTLAIIGAYWLVRRVEGMGYGDVKMLAMIGAAAGWRAMFGVVFLASVVGAVTGISVALRRRSNLQFAMPFGVFLGFAFLAVLFFGPTLMTWYLSLLLH